MKRILITTFFVIALSLLVTGVAHAQDGSPDGAAQTSVAIATMLAPLVAAATAVERLVEMVFDWYESTVLDLSKFPAEASNYVNWARKEVEKFKNDLLLPRQVEETEQQLIDRLQQAEEGLIRAQERLKDYLVSPTYTSQKKKISLILGILLGVVLALVAQIKMFSLLGIPLPANLTLVDMIFTGLVIGTGSAPVHSLIGIIQNTKDAVDGARALWKGKATADVQSVLLQYQKQLQTYPVGAPAPLAGSPGVLSENQAAAQPAIKEMTPLEMDRMVQRMLRSR